MPKPNPKELLVRAMTLTPLYRVLPPGGVRTYAGLRYLAEHAPAQLADFVAASAAHAPRHASSAVIAARAALRSGEDVVLDRLLREGLGRFPDAAELYVVRGELAAFRGDVAAGLADARAARLLSPSLAAAAALEVRLAYRVEDEEMADRVAVAALARFPQTASVLWASCKECRTAEQHERLVAAWRAAVPAPRDLTRVVRQLATAAGRAGLTDAAIDLYDQAIDQVLAGATPPAVRDTRLEGRGAWGAIVDLVEVLDRSGIPYFFAAGTVLGLVREGRPLAADGDIDVGILEEDFDLDRLRALFNAHPRFDLDVVHPSTHKLGLRHRGGSPVDVFRFYREGDRVWHDAVFVRWHNSPFDVDRLLVGGIAAPIPADRERYLTESYGEDWRTPNPGFDAFTDDAPNVEVTWPDYHRLHLVRRAYKRLTGGDHRAAAADARTAGEDALAARIEATHG